MKPALAALLAGPFALLGLALGLFFGGLAHWLVALLGGFVGLAWLADPVRSWVVFAGPIVGAGLGYFVFAHGREPALTAGQVGVVVGAVLGSVGLLLGLTMAVVPIAPAVLGAAAALAAAGAGRAPAPQP